MTKREAQAWAHAASRETIYDFLLDTVHKLDAVEGSAQFAEASESETSDSIKDAAEMLRTVLANEFATRL